MTDHRRTLPLGRCLVCEDLVWPGEGRQLPSGRWVHLECDTGDPVPAPVPVATRDEMREGRVYPVLHVPEPYFKGMNFRGATMNPMVLDRTHGQERLSLSTEDGVCPRCDGDGTTRNGKCPFCLGTGMR